jgi:hypothetical protein
LIGRAQAHQKLRVGPSEVCLMLAKVMLVGYFQESDQLNGEFRWVQMITFMVFNEVIFDKVIFDKVIFDKVIFDKVIFDKVIFDKVRDPHHFDESNFNKCSSSLSLSSRVFNEPII